FAVGEAPAAPEVHDLLAAPVGGDRRADLAAIGEVALELVAHALETARHLAVRRHVMLVGHRQARHGSPPWVTSSVEPPSDSRHATNGSVARGPPAHVR